MPNGPVGGGVSGCEDLIWERKKNRDKTSLKVRFLS